MYGIDNKKKVPKKNIYCVNCGNAGHYYKNCIEPIISYGLIDIKIDNLLEDDKDKLKELYTKDKIDILDIPGIHYQDNIFKFKYYRDNIKFLLIRRKHTLGYIEFLRGHYRIDNIDGIIYLFKQMIKDEIDNLKKYSFDELWIELWGKSINNKDLEYKKSKTKFDKLLTGDVDILNLQFYIENIKPQWDFPEWGFPKGRRNNKENDIECAKREFNEETGIDNSNYKIMDTINPMIENFIGTNGIKYRHIYYICMSENNYIDLSNYQYDEIGDIGWYSYNDILRLIRPYHTKRIKIISELYMYIMNILIK